MAFLSRKNRTFRHLVHIPLILNFHDRWGVQLQKRDLTFPIPVLDVSFLPEFVVGGELD